MKDAPVPACRLAMAPDGRLTAVRFVGIGATSPWFV